MYRCSQFQARSQAVPQYRGRLVLDGYFGREDSVIADPKARLKQI
jgi:hypothetical protein